MMAPSIVAMTPSRPIPHWDFGVNAVEAMVESRGSWESKETPVGVMICQRSAFLDDIDRSRASKYSHPVIGKPHWCWRTERES